MNNTIPYENLRAILRSISNSYSQVFFSNNQILSVIIIIITFFDVYTGIAGMFAVLVSNLAAYLIGYNKLNIKAGYYGFNSLLVGLGLGLFYQPAFEFYILLFFTAVLTLLITVSLEGVIGKYGLPFLSVSFLLTIWMVSLATREFSSLAISERGVFKLNEMYLLGGVQMLNVYQWFNDLPIHESVKIYFRSLGAIFFQYNLLAGLLIAFGLLIYSRITVILSLLGFYAAFSFYQFIGADITELSYNYIGFNFILSAIAVGGIFIVPSKYSFIWVVLLTPIISIIITSTSTILGIFQLSILSLPFNLIVLLFLYTLKFRDRHFSFPETVAAQQFSPENNLYSQKNYNLRFESNLFQAINLPFWGFWKVTQAHSGEHTHKEEWKFAWDFEIVDDDGLLYSESGNNVEDYYCYNKPVVAPADGQIADITDGIDDNKIGDMNLKSNWGNSLVIKHRDKVYTQLSHLRKNSFQVSRGDYVKKGDILAYVGNSGRSLIPHLHFQIQENPSIGSKTKYYPISNYISQEKKAFLLHGFDNPLKDQLVSNIEQDDTLKNALHFIPGQKLHFSVETSASDEKQKFEWEVRSDMFNNTFFYCKNSKAKAYFSNFGNTLCFTNYMGKHNTLLYYFYLGAFKIATGYYKNLKVNDRYPVNIIKNSLLKIVQDIIAPFYIFIKPEFELRYIKENKSLTDNEIFLASEAKIELAGKLIRHLEFEFRLCRNMITEFNIHEGDKKITAIRTED